MVDPLRVNGKLIKFHRGQLKWTQEELASRAKLSVRVVAKAEASETISPSSLQRLASGLRAGGIGISSQDLVVNVEYLSRLFLQNYAEYEAECIAQSSGFVSPQVVAIVDGDPSRNPIAGSYFGIDRFDKLFKTFFRLFARDSTKSISDFSTRVNGSEVIVWGHETIRIRENKTGSGETGFVMCRMVFEEGLIARFEVYYEQYGLTRALQEWAAKHENPTWLQELQNEDNAEPPLARRIGHITSRANSAMQDQVEPPTRSQ